MPVLRLILLAVLALGTQVPGLRLELCLCRGIGDLFHGHERKSEEPGCCAASAAADPEDGEATLARSCDGECSRCIEVTTHGHPPIGVRPSGTTQASAVPIALVAFSSRPLVRERVRSVTDRAHDPPRARRNLPLRI
jgi:hypothetical protein